LSPSRQPGAQLPTLACLGLWAGACLGVALYASWHGYGGRGYAATLTVFAFLLAAVLFPAARGVSEWLGALFGSGTGYLLGAAAYLAYLLYALENGALAFRPAGIAAALVFLPLLLAASAEGAAPGAWQDFLTLAGLWAAVKFLPLRGLLAFPSGQPGRILAVLLALTVALAAFLFVRRVDGTGYSLGWGRGWGLYIFGSFAVFLLIAAPLGQAIHFIRFEPLLHAWRTIPITVLGIFFFTAWPEEFFFRGLLQNLLGRASKSEFAGWWTASLLFGLAHITNSGFPNWRYALLAAIAGLSYGWTWRKSGSIFASALVHTLVNVTWHFFFRTL